MGTKYRNLYEQIYDFENLWLASRKARRGKRLKNQTSEFEYNLEANLFGIQEALMCENYKFSGYREFIIKEPKERLICAAPYRDRVVHHAICNIIEPILDKAMIFDSYACRKSKGSHKAINRAHHFLRSSEWVLKIDIKKYFFSIDHEILFEDINRKISDKKLLHLIDTILDTYNSKDEYYYYFDGDNLFDGIRKRGLPIGNLTSQLFANYYLSSIDRFVKEKLKFEKYIRYMDDCILFSNCKRQLQEAKDKIEELLFAKRLKINEKKCQIFPVNNGINFLGFHLYPFYKRILRQNLQRFKRRMKVMSHQFSTGKIEMKNLLLSLNAWLGYADKEINQSIINDILDTIYFRNNNNTNFRFIV